MSSDVDLCSAALIKLGASPIASLASDAAEAVVAQRLYPITRDALLSCHPWDFTLAEASLMADPAITPNGWATSFILPPDLLRSLSAGGSGSGRGLACRIIGNRLRTDSSSVTLSYQRRAMEAEFPAHFVAALVARLAAEFALPITENTSRADVLQKLATAELRLARLIDSQQSTPQSIDDFTLVNVRYR